MRNLRKREGLTRWQLAQAMGYEGKRSSLETQIKRWEGGHRPIPPWIIRLLMYMDAYTIPKDWYDE